MTEIRHEIRHEAAQPMSPRRRNPWLRPVIAAGAVATVAALTLVVLPGGGSDGPATAKAQSAATLLENIALAAEGTELPSGIRDDQFVYIKSRVAYTTSVNGGPAKLDPVHDREIWLSVDGKREGLLEEDRDGSEHQALAPDSPKNDRPVNYRALSELPTDPDKMLDWLYRTSADGIDEETPDKDYVAFVLFGDMIRESLMPPEVSAALYRAAARIPGVELVRNVKDSAGRTGVAVTRADSDGETEQLIFDSGTYAFLGERELDADGRLTGSSAVLKRTVVDRPGQRP